MDYFNFYNHLGFHNPYYLVKDGQIEIYNDFQGANNDFKDEKILDFTAITQVLGNGYMLGDRTLIKGIRKSPWMAKPDLENQDWKYYKVPNHLERDLSKDEIAKNLFSLLQEEMLQYIANSRNIGLLLTGGMDSRIVACVLQNLIETGLVDKNINVTAITWGNNGSRDIVYASRIASFYNWEWKHLSVNASQLLKNIEITAKMGCEFSPLHLHAMEEVSEIQGLDCILAGSFGDSIGRGEYSGVRVKDLKTYSSKTNNLFGLIRSDYEKLTKDETFSDIRKYHDLFPQTQPYQQTEQDYQLHYMRRMLNSCMSLIDKKTPLFQMFSSPSVFGFMWSLNPEMRNDSIYYEILKNYNKGLLEIPWARTGLVYPSRVGTPDKLSKNHHSYGEMFSNDLLPLLKDQILSSEISKLNLFDMKSLKKLVSLCINKPIKGSHSYEEKLIWIASLAEFIFSKKIVSNLNGNMFEGNFTKLFKSTIEYNLKFIKKN